MLTPIEYTRISLLQPPLRNAVPAMVRDIEAATGKRVRIGPNAAWRSYATQLALYNARASNPYPVVAPGQSFHQVGAAVDPSIDGGTDADYRVMRDIVQGTYGFVSGYPTDNVHVRLNESLAQAQADWDALTASRWSFGLIAGVAFVGVVVLSQED